MGFSEEWDKCYADNTQLSVWPWSDLVSLVHRHCKDMISDGEARVLELGCGAGANIPFFRSLGMQYHAIEGSETIVNKLGTQHRDFADNIHCGDFTADQPFEGLFDLVFDRAAVTHNSEDSIRAALHAALSSLKPGGIFIGSDWFSTKHTDYWYGECVDDKFTRTNFTRGQFVGVGKVHFSDEAHLRSLFSKFEILLMEEKIIEIIQPPDGGKVALWNIVAKRIGD